MTSFVKNVHQKDLNSAQEPYALLSERDCAQLEKWNTTFSEYEKNISAIQKFEEMVEKNPYNPALCLKDQILTYHELNDRANQLAHYIKEKTQDKTSKIIGICLEPSFDLLIGILAILKTGSAYLPLDPFYPPERLNFMLNDSNAAGLITTEKFQTIFSHAPCHVIRLDGEQQCIAAKPISNVTLNFSPTDLAYIIYTSGSTGQPKGVMISQQNLNHFFHWFTQAVMATPQDVFDFSSSISFDFTVPMTLFPLVKGATIAICPEKEKKDPLAYIKHLTEQRVTITKLTPSYFRQLKEFVEKDQTFPDLRLIVFGGESLLKSDIEDWLKQFSTQTIMNEYGPTEATVATTWLTINSNTIEQFPHAIPIGKPALNSQIYVLNDSLQCQPIGTMGEIYIGGEGVAQGYLNRPEMSAKKFLINPFSDQPHERMYKTGDLGRYLENGSLEFQGRVDHQIKIRGFRVELEEITNCLSIYPSLKQAIVLAKEESAQLDKKLIAYCIARDKCMPDIQDIKNHILAHLPEYMLPSAFIFVKRFPLTTNGKLDLKALAQIEQYEYQEHNDPQTEQEKQIQLIWMSILNLPHVNRDEDFFELGGNSLSAARIINQLRKITHKDINLNELYEAPTIMQLTALLANKTEIVKNNSVPSHPDLHNKKIPLSAMQFLFWLMENFTARLSIPNITQRQRVRGVLSKTELENAFKRVFEKHAILTYHISRYSPLQFPQKNISFQITEEDLSDLSSHDQKAYLFYSLNQLKNEMIGKKNQPLISVSLFYLGKNVSELQIALPHIISDDVSSAIVMNDLSLYYTHPRHVMEDVTQFKEYVRLEHNGLTTLNRDIEFWERYLEDVSFLKFQPSDLFSAKNCKELGSTSCVALSDMLITRLNDYSAKLRLNSADILCATVALALKKYFPSDASKKIVVNFVKSTRDNEVYDKTIGLFIRTDLIKIDLSQEVDLVSLSKQIKATKAVTAAYQFCPEIIKLSAALKQHWKNKKMANMLIHTISYLLAKLFKRAEVNSTVLSRYGKVLIANEKSFFININILNQFLSPPVLQNKAFGFDAVYSEKQENEKMSAQNVLDICFDRNAQQEPCLIIRANLKPEVREAIGKEINCVIQAQLLNMHKTSEFFIAK